MKALNTRVGSYVTGDAVADAVLSYSVALARVGRIDLVDVPFRTTGGDVSRVRLRVGWMVDIDCVTQDHHRESELTDHETTDDLRRRESALDPSGDAALGPDEIPSVADGLYEY